MHYIIYVYMFVHLSLSLSLSLSRARARSFSLTTPKRIDTWNLRSYLSRHLNQHSYFDI